MEITVPTVVQHSSPIGPPVNSSGHGGSQHISEIDVQTIFLKWTKYI